MIAYPTEGPQTIRIGGQATYERKNVTAEAANRNDKGNERINQISLNDMKYIVHFSKNQNDRQD